MIIDEATIESNFQKYFDLLSRLNDPGVTELMTAFADRIATCPLSTRTSYIGCYPGGLVTCSLRITSTMRKLADMYQEDISPASIFKVGLLHDVGKVGDINNDLFLSQDSEWHREKLGELFKYNELAPRMPHAERTLFLLQHFGIKLTYDEYVAIAQAHGLGDEKKRFFGDNVPPLAMILRHAKESLVE